MLTISFAISCKLLGIKFKNVGNVGEVIANTLIGDFVLLMFLIFAIW